MTIRLLYLTREPHPSFRPDLLTLFGRCLPRYGVQSDIVALGAPAVAASSTGPATPSWQGGTAHTRSGRGSIGRLRARLRAAFDLFGLARSGAYDAVQVRDRIGGALIGLLAARWSGVPFFYWMSFPFPDLWRQMGDAAGEGASLTPAKRRLWRWRGLLASFVLYRLVLPRADHLFVQSDAMAALLAAKGLPRARMTPVPMGVEMPADVDAVAPSDDVRLQGRRVLAYLGTLERIRHPEVMVHAMADVVRTAPDALLLLVGDSPMAGERAWLEQEIARLGLQQHVIVTGWLAPADAWRYLRAASIGLSPFPRTPILEVASPTKVCEYLAYGVPVVANDQPDQAALIAATGGGLCVPLTAAGFADGMLALLGDPQRAQAMAASGRAAIGRLRSYDVLAASLADTYRRLLPHAARQTDAVPMPSAPPRAEP